MAAAMALYVCRIFVHVGSVLVEYEVVDRAGFLWDFCQAAALERWLMCRLANAGTRECKVAVRTSRLGIVRGRWRCGIMRWVGCSGPVW